MTRETAVSLLFLAHGMEMLALFFRTHSVDGYVV